MKKFAAALVVMVGGIAGMVALGGQTGASASQPAIIATPTVLRFTCTKLSWPGDGRDKFDRPGSGFAPSSVFLTAAIELSEPVATVLPAVTVTSFADDRGGDFTKKATASVMQSSDEILISKDHKSVLVSVSMSGLPAPEARTVVVKGSLAVLRDTPTETYTIPDVPLQLGQEIKAGDVTLALRSASHYMGDSSLTFRSSVSEAIKRLEFLDANGKPFPMGDRVRRDTLHLSDKSVQHLLSYSVHASLKRTATLRVTIFKNPVKVEVPFTMTAGIGLPATLR